MSPQRPNHDPIPVLEVEAQPPAAELQERLNELHDKILYVHENSPTPWTADLLRIIDGRQAAPAAASASMGNSEALSAAPPSEALLNEFTTKPALSRVIRYLDTLVGMMEDQALKDLDYGFTQDKVYSDLKTFHEAPGGAPPDPELVARLANYLACWEGLTDDQSLRDLDYGFTNQDIRDALGELGVGEEMKQAGFCPAWKSPEGCNEFERYPSGFGADGQDRIERITLGAAGEFIADSRHLKHDGGLAYYNATSPTLKTVAEAEAWFTRDRAMAQGGAPLAEAMSALNEISSPPLISRHQDAPYRMREPADEAIRSITQGEGHLVAVKGPLDPTPLSDALEETRLALGQERTPAYGDALRLARALEARVGGLERSYQDARFRENALRGQLELEQQKVASLEAQLIERG